MIGTEQERAALKRILAVLKPILTDHNPPIAIDWVGKGAIAVGQEFELAINAVREHKDDAAIRAMLAPPDDAVLRLTEDERDLLETIAWCGVRNGSMTVGAYEGLTDGKDYSAIAQSLIDRFDAVLRGEATRDE